MIFTKEQLREMAAELEAALPSLREALARIEESKQVRRETLDLEITI